jgi:alpha-ribazole phosphatase
VAAEADGVAATAAAPSRFADLLRHGEAAGGPCFRGSRDDPLTALGWSQLRAAVQGLCEPAAWDAVLCSPAQRCAAFAHDLGSRLALPVTEMPALRERHFGVWEGCRAADLPLAALQAFWRDPVGFTPPQAESLPAFQTRVTAAWRQVELGRAERPLLVTHGGVVRVIVGAVLGMPATSLLLLEVPHACRTRLRLAPAGGQTSLICHG